jgi:hypothetical protein
MTLKLQLKQTIYDNGTPHTYLLWSYWRNVIDKQVDLWYNFHTFCLIYFLNIQKKENPCGVFNMKMDLLNLEALTQ